MGILNTELGYFLDDILQVSMFDDYGPNGLQVEGKSLIERIGYGVSASLSTIQQAVEAQVDALMVHHGIFWEGDTRSLHGVKREKIRLLIENGINLYAYHLPLDAHQELGNNWKAAKDLKWQHLSAFGKHKGIYLGVQGELTTPMTGKVLKKTLETYYQHPASTAGDEDRILKKVGLISGGSHWEINQAIASRLDAFITGSFDEPIWHIAREEGIFFLALGHSHTEKVGPRALLEFLHNKKGIKGVFIEDHNPF